MRWIVTIGWAIYPIGYFMGYLNGAVSDESLNVIYNIADVWNKIAFGVIIWNVAVTESDQLKINIIGAVSSLAAPFFFRQMKMILPEAVNE